MIKQDSLTGSTLAGAIRRFYEDRVSLNRMKESVKRFGKPEASKEVVDDYLKLIGERV